MLNHLEGLSLLGLFASYFAVLFYLTTGSSTTEKTYEIIL